MTKNKQNGWITVSEQMPEPDTPVWAGWFNPDGKFEYGLHVYSCYDCDDDGCYHTWLQCRDTQSNDNFRDWIDADNNPDFITHWQPLPEPPKG